MNSVRPPESVLELLRKVQTLAVCGANGERMAARLKLNVLLRKHGITESALQETETSFFQFRVKSEREELLIMCVVARVAHGGKCPDIYRGHRKGFVAFKLTPAQAVDVETQYEFYLKLFEAELKVFFRAFVFAQNLGLEPGAERQLTDEQAAENRRVSALKTFILSRTPHRQLEGVPS